MNRDLKYEYLDYVQTESLSASLNYLSWLDSSGSVFCVASFGRTLAEIILLVVMTKHCRRALYYPLQCLTSAGLTPVGPIWR